MLPPTNKNNFWKMPPGVCKREQYGSLPLFSVVKKMGKEETVFSYLIEYALDGTTMIVEE